MSWGPMELGLIALIVILLFGAGKLSQVGRSLGTSISEFKSAIKESKKDETPETPAAAAADGGPAEHMASLNKDTEA